MRRQRGQRITSLKTEKPHDDAQVIEIPGRVYPLTLTAPLLERCHYRFPLAKPRPHGLSARQRHGRLLFEDGKRVVRRSWRIDYSVLFIYYYLQTPMRMPQHDDYSIAVLAVLVLVWTRNKQIEHANLRGDRKP